VIPRSPCGLYQHACSRVRNIDEPLDARLFPQQRPLVHATRRRIGCAIGGELLSACGNRPGNRKKKERANRKTKARK
jgi:hypothetical protein